MVQADDNPKKIGELLVGAGLVPEERLSEGLEYARKHRLPLGRVLITLKIVSEEDLESVLHSQALMKMDRLPARLAVKAMALASAQRIPIDRALKKLGWFSERYVEGEKISIAVAREQLSNCEKSFGADHPETAAGSLKLAQLLSDNGIYAESEQFLKRAEKIIEDCFGRQSIEMANLLSQTAAHYFAQDRFEEAEKNYWQAYEIKRALLGEYNLSVAQCLEDLAELYDVQSEYLQAQRLYLSSLGIKEKIPLEADDPELISTLRKLVLICRQSDPSRESRPTGELLVDAGIVEAKKIEEGLELAEKYRIPLGKALINLRQLSQEDLQRVMHAQLLMKDAGVPGYVVTRALRTACRSNSTVSESLKTLGWKCDHPADQKQLELLLRCSEELIRLEQRLTPDHPEVAEKCSELAGLYAGSNNLREAEMLLKRAVQIYSEHIGEDEPATAEAISALAQVHCRQNRFEEARSMIKRAVELSRKAYSYRPRLLADALEKQARICSAAGEHEAALSAAEELLTLLRKLDKGEAFNCSNAFELKGDILREMRRLKEARAAYGSSLNLREKVFLGGNPLITGLLNKMGEIEMQDKNHEEALKYFRRALELTEKTVGEIHPLAAYAHISLADCYAVVADHKNAMKHYEAAVGAMEKNSADIVAVLNHYSDYLKSAGKKKEAEKIDERLRAVQNSSDARATSINLKVSG